MDDWQLQNYLRSVGMRCFVKYFGELADDALSNQALIEILQEREGYREKSCRSRVIIARSIIKAGRARDALLMVANAGRVSRCTAEKAKELLADGPEAGRLDVGDRDG